jgi:hypothetical protein
MTAYAMQWPDDEVYLMFVLPMRVRTLVIGLFVFNLVMGVLGTGDGTNIAYFAHVGGVIAAYIYMRMSTATGMDQVRQRVANIPDADEPPRHSAQPSAPRAATKSTSSRRAKRLRQRVVADADIAPPSESRGAQPRARQDLEQGSTV